MPHKANVAVQERSRLNYSISRNMVKKGMEYTGTHSFGSPVQVPPVRCHVRNPQGGNRIHVSEFSCRALLPRHPRTGQVPDTPTYPRGQCAANRVVLRVPRRDSAGADGFFRLTLTTLIRRAKSGRSPPIRRQSGRKTPPNVYRKKIDTCNRM